MGQAPPSSDCNFDGRGTPFVKAGEFGSSRPVIREWTTNPLKHARKSDVLLCVVGATCGKLNLGEDCAIGRSVAALRPKPRKLNQFYLHYFLMTLVDRLRSGSVGAAQTVISKEMIQSLPFPWREVSEQQRIVAILDEAFEGIATAKANAEKNLQNARTLSSTAMRSILDTAAPDWIETTIGDQVTLQRGFDITKDQQRAGSVPVVSSGGIRSYHDTAMVKAPGVVMGRKGTLGKVFFLQEDFWPHDTSLWVKDFKGNEPRFVHRFFEVLDVRGLDSGAANPALNRNQVHPLVTRWPPKEEQAVIADKMDALAEEAQRLAAVYECKLAALDELKKSLLHQAFSGQL